MSIKTGLLSLVALLFLGETAFAAPCSDLLKSSEVFDQTLIERLESGSQDFVVVEIRVKPSEDRSFEQVLGMLEVVLDDSEIIFSVEPTSLEYGVIIGPRMGYDELDSRFQDADGPIANMVTSRDYGIVVIESNVLDLERLAKKMITEVTKVKTSAYADTLATMKTFSQN